MRSVGSSGQCAFPVSVGRRRGTRGFTLIELMLAMVIISTAVLALVSAQAAFHKKNFWAENASMATYLANEIREMTFMLPAHDPVTGDFTWGPETENEISVEDFDDLDDFDGPPPLSPAGTPSDGLTFDSANGSGPINSQRQVIPNMPGWSQTVRVFNVDPRNITYDPEGLIAGVLPEGSTDTLAVEVTVSYKGVHDTVATEMTRVSWIAPH